MGSLDSVDLLNIKDNLVKIDVLLSVTENLQQEPDLEPGSLTMLEAC